MLDPQFRPGEVILECKTRGWQQKQSGATALYKLDTLKDLLGGLQGRAMLVSYHPLDKASKRRADDLGIRYCDAGQVANLGAKIRQWVGS